MARGAPALGEERVHEKRTSHTTGDPINWNNGGQPSAGPDPFSYHRRCQIAVETDLDAAKRPDSEHQQSQVSGARPGGGPL